MEQKPNERRTSTESTIAGEEQRIAGAERSYTQDCAPDTSEMHRGHSPAAYRVHAYGHGDAAGASVCEFSNPYEAAYPSPYPLLLAHKVAAVVEQREQRREPS